jgi:hypothetical protein
MFGLENQKKKKFEPFVFDLEKEWKDAKKHRENKERIEGRIQRIKTILKSGERKEEFDEFGVMLHGYTSLLKVMARCLAK